MRPEKVHRGKMQCIKRTDRHGERLQSAGKHGLQEVDQGHLADKDARIVQIRLRQSSRVNAI